MNEFINRYSFVIALEFVSFVFFVLGYYFIFNFLYYIYFVIVGVITWLLFYKIIALKKVYLLG